MLLTSRQKVCHFDNRRFSPWLDSQQWQGFRPSPLLPELRGEWVREDLGRERKEFLNILLVKQRWSLSVRGCLGHPRQPPCGVLTHPSGPRRHI